MRRPFLLALTLLSTVAPLGLSAQIRVPRPRVPNPLDRVRAATTPARTPTFDETVIEITDGRLASLIRGLRAEQDQRPALEAGYKRNADARAAHEVEQRRQRDQLTRPHDCLFNSAEYRAIFGDTVSRRRAAERLEAARERGDDDAVRRIQDSLMQAVMAAGPEAAANLAQAQIRCGSADTAQAVLQRMSNAAPPPAPPARPLADSLRIIGTGVSGMTPEQYAMMRERVLAFLTTDEDALRGSLWAYTGAELTALRAKRSELERYQALLVEG
jgi:hypothetical protein